MFTLFVCRAHPSGEEVSIDQRLHEHHVWETCSRHLRSARRDQNVVLHYFPSWPWPWGTGRGCEVRADEPLHHGQVTSLVDLFQVGHGLNVRSNTSLLVGMIEADLLTRTLQDAATRKLDLRLDPEAIRVIARPLPQTA